MEQNQSSSSNPGPSNFKTFETKNQKVYIISPDVLKTLNVSAHIKNLSQMHRNAAAIAAAAATSSNSNQLTINKTNLDTEIKNKFSEIPNKSTNAEKVDSRIEGSQNVISENRENLKTANTTDTRKPKIKVLSIEKISSSTNKLLKIQENKNTIQVDPNKIIEKEENLPETKQQEKISSESNDSNVQNKKNEPTNINVSEVRKSTRKRKLSTHYKNFITDFKLQSAADDKSKEKKRKLSADNQKITSKKIKSKPIEKTEQQTNKVPSVSGKIEEVPISNINFTKNIKTYLGSKITSKMEENKNTLTKTEKENKHEEKVDNIDELVKQNENRKITSVNITNEKNVKQISENPKNTAEEINIPIPEISEIVKKVTQVNKKSNVCEFLNEATENILEIDESVIPFTENLEYTEQFPIVIENITELKHTAIYVPINVKESSEIVVKTICTDKTIIDPEDTHNDKTLDKNNYDSDNITEENESFKTTKIKEIKLNKNKIVSDSSENEEVSKMDTSFNKSPRSRGRPKGTYKNFKMRNNKNFNSIKVIEDSESDSENENLENLRNRIRKEDNGKQSEVNELEKKTEKTSKIVQCAICNEVFTNNKWTSHAIKHNFLCWRVGDDPIDLNNKKVCETILTRAKLLRKLKYFTCQKCKAHKKSAAGFLSHMDVCQKSFEEIMANRVACSICGKVLLPVSMKSHIALVHNNNKPESVIVEKEEGRTQRKAASKAIEMIKGVCEDNKDNDQYDDSEDKLKRNYKPASEIHKLLTNCKKFIEQKIKKSGSISCKINNCQFKSSNFKDIKEHIETCPNLTETDYVCSKCFQSTKTESSMIIHLRKVHHIKSEIDKDGIVEEKFTSDDNSESDEDLEIEQVLKKSAKPKNQTVNLRYKVQFLAKEKKFSSSLICAYPPAARWTLEYYEKNYYQKNLFPILKCLINNWTPIAVVEEVNKYLPEIKESVDVKSITISKKLPNLQIEDHTWKKYHLFESNLENDIATIYCGGPIFALAWLPTPFDKICDQFLAVSVEKTFDTVYKLSKCYSSEGVIQIWNFGSLQNYQPIENVPKLEYCLAHNHGNIWCMEWCPSGCYNEDSNNDSNSLKRFGLLALACTDGTVPIYSMPFPNHLEKSPLNNYNNFYKPREVCKLILQEENEQKLGTWEFQVTKLTWSKNAGHNVIVAGYTTGLVCIWDLKTESPLIRKEENGILFLRPYFTYQPHAAPITALQLSTLDGGLRWLVTGSWDRNIFLWDLHYATSNSIMTYVRRGNVTDGVLLNHWLSAFFSFDDVHSIVHTVTILENVREFGFKPCTAMVANSMIMGLSSSEWANAIAQVTLSGELVAGFPNLLLVNSDIDKTIKHKRVLLGYTELFDKHLDPATRAQKCNKNKKKSACESTNNDQSSSKHAANKKKLPYEEEPTTYEEAKNKYGLIFCDISLDDVRSIPTETFQNLRQSIKMRDFPPELYPIASQNRVQYNPNKQSFLYICSAYQTGFVRLRNIRFMSKILSEV